MDNPICKKNGGNSMMDGDPNNSNSNLSQFFLIQRKFKKVFLNISSDGKSSPVAILTT